jgi:hypothetical protein
MFLPMLVLMVLFLFLFLRAFVTRVPIFWRARRFGIGRLGPEFNFGGHGPGRCGYGRSGSKRRERGGGRKVEQETHKASAGTVNRPRR